MPSKRPRQPPFHCGEYDISDQRLARHREITIRSAEEPVPQCGDRFTIVRGEVLHDLTVMTVRHYGADWIARCSVASPT
jgi:hypothetical protein